MHIQVDDLWGKINKDGSTCSLIKHMEDVAITAKAILLQPGFKCVLDLICESLGMEESKAINLICYEAAMHDIGKVDPRFQCNDAARDLNLPIVDTWDAIAPASYSGEVSYRHEYGSGEYIHDKLRSSCGRYASGVYASIVALHHQGKGSSCQPYAHEEWEAVKAEIDRHFEAIYHPEFPSEIKRADAFGYVCVALIILADWIASSLEENHSSSAEPMENQISSFLIQAGLTDGTLLRADSFEEMWSPMGIRNPSPMQKELSTYLDSCTKEKMPAVVLIESEPGSGKTEAAVYAALKMADAYAKAGVYFGLPTMATANGMVDRVNDLYTAHGLPKARLLHGMAWMKNDVRFGSDAEKWFSPTRLGLLQPSGVGTVDQCMAGVLPLKYGSLRLLGLSSKVLIIDEVHSYDDYMLAIICRLLDFCRALRIPVVMLSATLPSTKKKDLLAPCLNKAARETYKPSMKYPLLTLIGTDGNVQAELSPAPTFKRSYSIKILENEDDQEILNFIGSLIQDGGCVCYYVNTVDRAQHMYDLAKQSFGDNAFLFHARFTNARREEIENECRRLFGKDKTHRPHKALLIATQVAEQSLDLDFDLIFSDLAPIDMIIQRIGRGFRHAETVRLAALSVPQAFIVCRPDLARSNEFIYSAEYLNRTQKELEKRDKLMLPDDIRDVIEAVYTSYDPSVGSIENLVTNMTAAAKDAAKAALPIMLLDKPASKAKNAHFVDLAALLDDADEPPATRSGLSSVRLAIIPDSLYAKYAAEITKGYVTSHTAKEIMAYAVSCYEYKLQKLPQEMLNKFEDGAGHLSGVKIAHVSKDFDATSDVAIHAGGKTIRVSREYGLQIQ